MEANHRVSIVLDNIRSALNVGAIFRTCDAASIEKLFLCGITAYPPHNKIPKTALGAENFVPWSYEKSTLKTINKLNESEYHTVAVEITEKAENFWNYNFKNKSALVFGNEVSGISDDILKSCQSIVKIPMYGKKKSLNVATSVGILIYEVLKQLRFKEEK